MDVDRRVHLFGSNFGVDKDSASLNSSGSVDEEEDEDEGEDSAKDEGDGEDADGDGGKDSVPGFNLHRRNASSILSGCSGIEERGRVKKSYAKIV